MRNATSVWTTAGLVVALAAALAACWTADPAAGSGEAAAEATPGPAAGGGEAMPSVEVRADRPLAVGEPLTLRLAPTGDLLAAIRALDPGDPVHPTLRLTLVDVETPPTEASLRVFLNHRAASPATPADHPRFAGEVGFYPTTAPPGAAEPPVSTFLLDLSTTLAELPEEERLVDGRFLDVTIVPVPLRDEPPPQDGAVELGLGGLRLSLHAPE